MRILLQNSLFWPDMAGGAERSTLLMARELSGRGHHVDVVCTTGRRGSGPLRTREAEGISGLIHAAPSHGLYDILRAPGAPRHRLPVKALHHLANIDSRRWNRLAAELLTSLRPDVLHTNVVVGMTGAVWRAARAAGTPVVHTIRDLHLLCPRTTLLRSSGETCEAPPLPCRILARLKRGASTAVTVATSPSRFNLDLHLRAGFFPGARSVVVPNACESLPDDLPERRGRGTVTGLFLGALAGYKGVPELLGALEILFADPGAGRLRFEFAGDGEMARTVDAFCARHPRRARRLGVIGGDEKEQALRRCDLVVVPSTCHDNFPRSILDGFSHAAPVVGSDRGGIPEVVADGVDGAVVAPRPAALAAALKAYVADDELRIAHGRAGRAKAESLTLDAQIDAFVGIYENLR